METKTITLLSKQMRECIKDKVAQWYDVYEIAEELMLDIQDVKYHAGLAQNSLPKQYIEDEKKRSETIRDLSEKRGKDYREILFLSYLSGRLSQDMYESAFYN